MCDFARAPKRLNGPGARKTSERLRTRSKEGNP